DAVGDVLHHREIVRDEDVREVEAPLKILQKIDHLRLDRDVERRDRLVADDEPRLDRERARDADALALPARELVRIAARVMRREADEPQQLLDARPQLLRSRDEAVEPQRLTENLAHGHARIERGIGVLEDDLHGAPERAHLVLAELEDIPAGETYGAGGRLDQAQHQPSRGRLAATRLAHERERLAGSH